MAARKKKPVRIRRIHYGDNLPILREMADDSVDLVYLDPPFNSNRDYFAVFRGPARARAAGDAKRQIKAFHDTWEWSALCDRLLKETAERSASAGKMLASFADGLGKSPMSAYLTNMAVRLVELRRVMKPTASIYLHCDPTANGYLRVMMDSIFGANNFQNDVVWHYSGGARGKKRWARQHDCLIFHTKGRRWTFNADAVLVPFESRMTEWRHAKGGQRGKPMPKGKVPDDVIPINIINPMAKERTGYPTQKPLALLERIIAASSNPGDLVLDPFCGCGTAPIAAEKLGRQWIGIDIAYRAVGILRDRMTREGERLLSDFDGQVEIIGEPKTAAEVDEKTGTTEAIQRREFEVFCIGQLGGEPNEFRGPDGGVDGRIPIRRHPGYYAIAEVKSGGATIGDLRALGHLTRQNSREPAGVLVLRECPPKTLENWRREAAKQGEWRRGIPRLQVVTLDDILKARLPKGIGRAVR